MAEPIPYDVQYSFSGFQQTNPSSPLPAPPLDNELANIETAIDSLNGAVRDIRRSDGALKNQIVGPDQLSPALNIGFTNRGTWTLAEVYNSGDGVAHDSIFYSARVQNTATNLNRPDLDPATWQQLFTIVGIVIGDGTVELVKLDAPTQALINGALQKASNLSDLVSASAARTNLGVPSLAGSNTFPSAQTFGDDVTVLGDFSVSGAFTIPALDVDTFTAASADIDAITAATATVTQVNTDLVRGATGSATTPTYGFTGDVNTGMYRDSADKLAFATGGTARLLISSDGALLFGSARIANPDGTVSDGISMNAGGAIDMMRTGFATLYQRRNDASGNIQEFYRSNTVFTGSISVSGSSTAYNTSSDETLKDFIGLYDPEKAIDIILRDPVRDFTWKDTGAYAVGWGAQTSYAVSKDLATPGEIGPDGKKRPWGVDQGKRTPYLWAAMTKVLRWMTGVDAQIAVLEARVAALETR